MVVGWELMVGRGGTKEEKELKGMVRVRPASNRMESKKAGEEARTSVCRFITQQTLIYTNRLFTRYGK